VNRDIELRGEREREKEREKVGGREERTTRRASDETVRFQFFSLEAEERDEKKGECMHYDKSEIGSCAT